MLNLTNLIQSLNELCEELHEEYEINFGGCCFVASLIAKHFDRLNILYELVVYNDYDLNIDDIQNEVSNKVTNQDSDSVTGYNTCSHYCLNVFGFGIINEGGFGDMSEHHIKNINSSNISWIYKNTKWNPDYLTINNNRIKTIINSFFKKYEENY